MTSRGIPRRYRLYRIVTVATSLLAALVIAEVGLRVFGPEYHRFPKSLEYYYSNPRGYFDVHGTDSDGRTTYGVTVQFSYYPLGRWPDHLDLQDTRAVNEYLDLDYRVLTCAPPAIDLLLCDCLHARHVCPGLGLRRNSCRFGPRTWQWRSSTRKKTMLREVAPAGADSADIKMNKSSGSFMRNH